MTLTELLEFVRRVEVHTNRLVTGGLNSNPIEFDGVGNYGEFATIKRRVLAPSRVLIPSNSMGLELERFQMAVLIPSKSTELELATGSASNN